MISFFEEDIKYNLKDKNKIKKWIKNVCGTYHMKAGAINFIFCSDEYLKKINKEYLKHNYYTDIITFDQSESKEIIDGELYISIDRVKDNADCLSTEFSTELKRVLVHGILHLIGYGDKTEEDENEMRLLENQYLEQYESL